MRQVIVGFAIVAPLLALALLSQSVVAAIGVLFASHMLLLYPTLRPTSQWLGPVVTSFETAEREVWLTIDDGPHERDTPAILDLLDEYGARATFFVKGSRAERLPDLIREVLRRGHTVGNHSHTHPSGTFWCLPPARLAREVDDCNRAIAGAAGEAPSLFRAPVGMKNLFVDPLLRSRGMQLVAWTARGFDAVTEDVEKVVSRILADVRPGAIILAHEGHGSGNPSPNVEALRQLLRRLHDDGYRFVVPEPHRFVCGARKTSR